MEQWLADVFSSPDVPTILSIAAKSALIYLFVFSGLRFLGARELGQMTTYDFVLVVLIANAVQNALVGGDNTLVGGLTSALTLLVVNRLLTEITVRFPQLERRIAGEPVVLVSDGQPRWQAMHREGITRDELLAALRAHAVGELTEVRLAVLEVDGTISVVPKDATVHRARRLVRGLRAS